jgi:hypothetical protein
MPKVDIIRKQVETQRRIAEEINAALQAAEDALTSVEDRESRRATRNRTSNPRERVG